MYLDMLEHAVQAMREGREPMLDRPLAAVSEIELHVPALLPEDYVRDVHLRLALYQRIAAADAAALQDMTAELIDRFGALPDAANNLLQLARLRLRARAARDPAAGARTRAAAACSSRSTTGSMPARVDRTDPAAGAGISARGTAQAAHHARTARVRAALRARRCAA